MKIKDVYIIEKLPEKEVLLVTPDQGSIDEEMPIVNDLRNKDKFGKPVFYYAKKCEESYLSGNKKKTRSVLKIVDEDGEVDEKYKYVSKLEDLEFLKSKNGKGITEQEVCSGAFYSQVLKELKLERENPEME